MKLKEVESSRVRQVDAFFEEDLLLKRRHYFLEIVGVSEYVSVWDWASKHFLFSPFAAVTITSSKISYSSRYASCLHCFKVIPQYAQDSILLYYHMQEEHPEILFEDSLFNSFKEEFEEEISPDNSYIFSAFVEVSESLKAFMHFGIITGFSSCRSYELSHKHEMQYYYEGLLVRNNGDNDCEMLEDPFDFDLVANPNQDSVVKRISTFYSLNGILPSHTPSVCTSYGYWDATEWRNKYYENR